MAMDIPPAAPGGGQSVFSLTSLLRHPALCPSALWSLDVTHDCWLSE